MDGTSPGIKVPTRIDRAEIRDATHRGISRYKSSDLFRDLRQKSFITRIL
jgi:hypothetical protein